MRSMPALAIGLLLSGVTAGIAVAGEDLEALMDRVAEFSSARRFGEAIPLAERAFELTETRFGRDSAKVADQALWLSYLYKEHGQRDLAERFYERAVAILERALGPDHPETATALSLFAEFHADQGKYALAEPLYERALAIRERVLGPDHADTASSLNLLAGVRGARGDYASGAELCQRALAIRERVLGPDHSDTGISAGNLAGFREEQGRYAQAEQLRRRALAIHEKTLGPDDPITATSLENLAVFHYQRGHYALAQPLYERSLAIRERAFGPDHPSAAKTLQNLAALHNAQGQHALAESLYKRAIAIREKSLGPDHPATAISLSNLAVSYYDQKRYALAEPLMVRALAIDERAFGPSHPTTAKALHNLAGLYDAQGQPERAEPAYLRALAVFEKSLAPDHPKTATVVAGIALLQRRQGRYEQAESWARRALDMRERTLGPDHPQTASAFHQLAMIQAARGRLSEAAASCDRARRATRRHVARALPALSAGEQAAFLRTQDGSRFHEALTLGLSQTADPRIAALSAAWLANGKAVAQEATAQRAILARQSGNAATAAAAATLDAVRAELARASQSVPAPDKAAVLRQRIATLQAEERRLVHEIGGQLAALDRAEPWVEIDAIRKNVPAGTVLVDIVRLRVWDFRARDPDADRAPAHYAAWVVPPAGAGDITVLDLGPAPEIDAAVAAHRAAIEAVQRQGFPRGQATAEAELVKVAAPLTRRVLEPIVAAVGDAREIVISPDGSLWLVPWQALPRADGTYAIESFTIRTVTSARDLVPPPEPPASGRGPSIVVADPAFDAAAGGTAARGRSFAPAAGVERRFGRLANTRTEALATRPAIATLTGSEPKVLLGADASETNLRLAAVRPRTLVLATHGFFKPDQEVEATDPTRVSLPDGTGSRAAAPAVSTTGEPLEDPLLRCGLALAGANVGAATGSGDDGILVGAEIVGLDLLGTGLVVLSACETGVGTVHNGEGVAGLRQAFQIAGARSVVATLWQVPDAESARIMKDFYGHLAEGLSVAQALRAAQLAFIAARREDRNHESAHPYLWAAYGVTGR